MKLKIKFTSAALAMTLLAMAGTAEAAFLSSTAWLDMASLTWETASGDAQLIWGSEENHNAESLAGDFGGTPLNQSQSGLTPVSTNLVFSGSGIAYADAYSSETLVQTSLIDSGTAMATATLERNYSISGSGNILLKLNYLINQEVTDLTNDFSFSNANVQFLDTLSGDQVTVFNQIFGFDVMGEPANGNYSFTENGTLELSLNNLNDGNQGSLVFQAYGNVENEEAQIKAVPEPAIALLLGSGLMAFISRRRKVLIGEIPVFD